MFVTFLHDSKALWLVYQYMSARERNEISFQKQLGPNTAANFVSTAHQQVNCVTTQPATNKHYATADSVFADNGEVLIIEYPHMMASWNVFLNLLQQFSTFFSLFPVQGYVWEPKHRFDEATHCHSGVQCHRVGLTEQPCHQLL